MLCKVSTNYYVRKQVRKCNSSLSLEILLSIVISSYFYFYFPFSYSSILFYQLTYYCITSSQNVKYLLFITISKRLCKDLVEVKRHVIVLIFPSTCFQFLLSLSRYLFIYCQKNSVNEDDSIDSSLR